MVGEGIVIVSTVVALALIRRLARGHGAGMTTATAAVRARATDRPLAGWICAAGGVIGVASGLVTAVVTPAAGMDMYRYPFRPHAYTVAQLVYAANHLMLLVGVLGYRPGPGRRAAHGG